MAASSACEGEDEGEGEGGGEGESEGEDVVKVVKVRVRVRVRVRWMGWEEARRITKWWDSGVGCLGWGQRPWFTA